MGQTVGTPSGWKGRGNPWREERAGEKVRRKGRKRDNVERWREVSFRLEGERGEKEGRKNDAGSKGGACEQGVYHSGQK